MIENNQYVTCPLCGANNYKIRFPATHSDSTEKSSGHFCCTNSHLSQHGDIVQCETCGMVYNNPQPVPDKLITIYKQVKDPLYLQEKRGREHTFRRSLQQLHSFTQPPGKLLDVGCYTGVFMQVAATEGWEVHGAELSTWASEIARKTGIGPVYEGTLHHISLPSNNFDVITLWDVIEHLSQPAAMLNEIADILRPGGVLALSTYLIDSVPSRLLGKRYPFLMDMHLVHFSRVTLK